MMKEEISKWAYLSIIGLGAFLTPIKTDMYLVGILVMTDWFTGVMKGIKTKEFTSTKAIRKYWVSLGYLCAILVARMVEVYFMEAIPIVKPMVVIIAISEIQSLRENINVLTGVDLFENIAEIFKRKEK
jgi:phage-related holin